MGRSRKPVATLVLSALSFILLCALFAAASTACALLYQRAVTTEQQAEDWLAALQGELSLLISSAQAALAQIQTSIDQTKKCACKH
jgi:predicted PurR-regulated permease PerM